MGERESVSRRGRESVSGSERVWERECVCGKEGERESVCERERVCV